MRSAKPGWTHRALLVALAGALAIPAAHAQAQPSEEDLKKANNPLANLTAFNVQNYYVPEIYGLPDDTANTLWLRYVRPFGRWLMRASLPVPSVPTATTAEPLSGLGDFNVFAAYLLKSTSTTTFGVGPLLVAPTATDDPLGSGKWQGGAAAVLFQAPSPQLQYGALLTWQGSFAGDSDRADTSTLVFQPFSMFQLGKGTYLRSAPIWVFDLENDTYQMPIGLGVGKILKAGSTVFNLFIEPQYTFLYRGAGQPALQIFTGLNMQFVPGKHKKTKHG